MLYKNQILPLKKRIPLDALSESDMKIILQTCLFLGKLMHVRGRKKMEKYFPHEVPDLRFVLSFIDVIESEKEKASKDESIYKIGVNSCPKLHEPQHCRQALKEAEWIAGAWLGQRVLSFLSITLFIDRIHTEYIDMINSS